MANEILCDLVLLTWNGFHLLEPCVRSLFRCTDLSCRLIVVDNGSTDPETLAYLRSLPEKSSMPVQVLHLPENRCIASALNEGLRQTSAPWICLLNNDLLVTPGWLTEMLRVAQTHPQIGLLNPMSNQFGVVPDPPEAVDNLAETLLKREQGRWLEEWNCVGFCMLLPRSVFEKVGLLDEEFRPFFFEDTDYAMKVRAAGWICAIAKGAYVYHHQGGTLRLDPARTEQFLRNRERFHKKWKLPQPMSYGWILGAGGEKLENAFKEIRQLANQGHDLWVLHTQKGLRLAPHYRIFERSVPSYLLPWKALRLLLLKKKRIDRLVTDIPWLAKAFRGRIAEYR